MTYRRRWATLGTMAWTTPRLDPDRSRRRLQILAELAGARAVRQRERPQRARSAQLRQLIAIRRRVTG
ncbi:hypothetical protein AWW66_25010 [Micromonospora rosaria]|uniref:Uncharacterized protein n=2 Tax=Micromonosporaceae TaxID=28056 RepID=A0A136PLG3_9ACTN|nr:hypothetical protein [Micromonospora rosaria]KXK59295.1 hypothetical protein AWW66_25010 [Micromonospora rosaria]